MQAVSGKDGPSAAVAEESTFAASRTGQWIAKCGVIGAVLCIAGIAAGTGAIHAKLYGHDIFFLMDNGWRALCGQRVHLDYSSGFGPVTFLLIAGGLAVSGGSIAAVSYANAFVAAVTGMWAAWLASGRSRTLLAVALPVFAALLAAAPFVLGEAPVWTSHGMVYNRYGYALLTILMLECFQPPREDRRSAVRKWLEPALTGCVLGLLLFLKVSYFLVALPIVGLSLLFRPPRMDRALFTTLGFLATALVFLAYLRFDAMAMVRDLMAAGAARSGSLGVRHELAGTLAGGILRGAPLCAAILWCRRSLRREPLWSGWFYPLAAALVVVIDMMLLLTNAQPSSYPLTAVFAMLLLLSVEAMPAAHAAKRLMLLATVLLTVPTGLMQAIGLGYAFVEARTNPNPPGVLRFDAARLRPLVLYDTEPSDIDYFSNGRQYVSNVNDGMRLLAAHTHPSDKVTTLDMFNPFSYALGREPIRGGIAAAAYRYTLDERHHPPAERFFADAAVVMVPKYPASAHMFYDGYREIYQPALEKDFRLEAESARWFLYRRSEGTR